jgi:hypothetical protein
MKKVFLIIAIAISASTYAQSTMKEDVDIIQGLYGKTKKELVNSYMQLTGTQATAFWKIYDAYEAERKALGQKKFQLIDKYADHFETLTDAQADELAKATLKNNMDFEKLEAKYYEKTKAVIGALNAAKFIQAEIYLQTSVRSAIQDNIPFIGEIDRTKTTQH